MAVITDALTKFVSDNSAAILGGVAVTGSLGLLVRYAKRMFRG